ncbi:YpiF family protein [Fictibacillus iocasae]|uniref:YpiF family protein n=1 Tax=Fictibacillus iocasae TaxID=2715437 RepID=A0ABW2NIM3_9BACL
MKWRMKDTDVFLNSRAFVDTLLIPLIPFSLGGTYKTRVNEGDYAAMLCEELERQLSGRLYLAPPFVYLEGEESTQATRRLIEWTSHACHDGQFKHVFYVTCDVEWKSREDGLSGSLLWLPAIPVESMDPEMKEELLKGQAKPLFQLIFSKWQEQ